MSAMNVWKAADHPRIRGEHTDKTEALGLSQGSSPHTRGAHRRTVRQRPRIRIIPAYAGSTRCAASLTKGPKDHPRIRGEHRRILPRAHPGHGSSPHTRGARRRPRVYPISSRIIPAYAGSTQIHLNSTGDIRDHPRIRGEHLNRIKNELPSEGSSPHTRGAPCSLSTPSTTRGIIPAYAGSTVRRHGRLPARPDHPRIRGEHPPCENGARAAHGSSPHTRGARKSTSTPPATSGIIPAYAGSTRPPRHRDRPAADHPRIRGEHSGVSMVRRCRYGSSPHTRGARHQNRRRPERPGIIPAYAGSTVCCS